jgi:hypothetical protein
MIADDEIEVNGSKSALSEKRFFDCQKQSPTNLPTFTSLSRSLSHSPPSPSSHHTNNTRTTSRIN